MPVHLKKAGKTPETESGNAREVVHGMLAEIEQRGEAAVREYAEKLDGWKGEIVVKPEEIGRRTKDIPQRIRQDIEFATERVARFALAQRTSLREFETEVEPGLKAGQPSWTIRPNCSGCRAAARRAR